MQNTEEEQEYESYHCPNPNCNGVFYRPKIIKYYVCPTCQTLIKRDTAQGNAKTKKHWPTEEDVKRKEAERLEAERKAERLKTERLEAERKGAKRIEVQQKLEQMVEQLAVQIKAERLKAGKKAKQLESERMEAQLKVEQLEAERLNNWRQNYRKHNDWT